MLTDAEFLSAYDGYTFEVSFDDPGNVGYASVELCEDGANIPLRKDNALTFVELYRQKYTEQDAL